MHDAYEKLARDQTHEIEKLGAKLTVGQIRRDQTIIRYK
jgi:hypothetical protein